MNPHKSITGNTLSQLLKCGQAGKGDYGDASDVIE